MKQFYLLLYFFIVMCFCAKAQQPASVVNKIDTSAYLAPVVKQGAALDSLLQSNRFLNSKATPVSLVQEQKSRNDNNSIFYILAGLALFFGLLKTIFPKYFSNMFRVFFNSSLQQSQLTDQLLQDKLPSLFFNLFFVMQVGIYVFLLAGYFHHEKYYNNWPLLGICVAVFAAIYLIKFISLKFTGWVTGYKQEAGLYCFIVFLINKITAICLLPIVLVMAFAQQNIVYIFVLGSFIIIGTLLLMRFLKSYGLLQHKLSISRFHFLLYIFSIEILPILILYKAALYFFSNNL